MMAAKEVPVKRALKSPDRAEWITAIEKEMKALEHRFTPIGQDHPEFATAKDTTRFQQLVSKLMWTKTYY